MNLSSQPLAGILATVFLMILSFAIISLFDVHIFDTWVAFLFMACIPTQIVCGLVWHCNYPVFAQQLSQPRKGLIFVLICILGGAIFAPAMLYTVGGGIAPTPQLMMYTITTVVVAFWIVGAWQAWPISALSKNPLVIGLGVLILCYLGAYLIFVTLFDFRFLAGAPIYVESLDPKGLIMAWKIMSFCVTTVAVIMFCILCGFWPISSIAAARENPAIWGIVASVWIVLVAGLVFYIATSVFNVDYVVYMVRGPVCFIFGAFIVLNLLQNSLVRNIEKQPLRGLVLAVICIVLAALMQTIYAAVGPLVSGPLPSGQPAYHLELWLANALLAITFPLIVIQCDFLNLWPFIKADKKRQD
jgi:hypothetical protein